METITANGARIQASVKRDELAEAELVVPPIENHLERVYKRIINRTNAGKNDLEFGRPLTSSDLRKLKGNGFKITTTAHGHLIEWK